MATKKARTKRTSSKTTTTKKPPKKRKPKYDHLDLLCTEINEEYEQPVICRADEMSETFHIRRPFGIMQMDLDVGGGLPAGGVSVISGEDQSGKTELLYYLMGMNQRIHGEESNIAFAPVEGGFDVEQCRRAGVQIALPPNMVKHKNRMRDMCGLPLLTDAEIGTTVGKIKIFRGDTGEETLKAAIRFIASGAFQLVLIDSFTALMPEANIDKDLDEEEKRAAWASMMTKYTNHMYGIFNPVRPPNYTTVVGTQQMRSNQERANAPSYMQKNLPQAVAKQAWAMRHIALIRLVLSEGSKIKRKIKGKETVVGKGLKWEVQKGKAGTHNHIRNDTSFYYDGFGFRPGVDRYGNLTVAAIRQGVLSETDDGVILRWPKEELLAENISELEERMRRDVEFDIMLRYYVMARCGIHRMFRL